MNILELLKPSDKLALIQGKQRVSYAELLDHGLRFGNHLRGEGARAGSHILVFMPLSIDLYTAMIGAWSIGASAIFIDFSRGPGFVSDSIERLKPDMIVCDGITGVLRHMYGKMRPIKTVGVKKRGAPGDIEKVDAGHPAILTFTSGSTGAPKVAVRTHAFLIHQYQVLRSHMDFSESHIDLGTLPVFTLASLAANMTTVLPEKSYRSRIDAAKLAGQMGREGVTRAICSPALMAELLQHSALPDLRIAYLGGGPVYPGVLKRMRGDVDLHVVYGSTEAEPIASIRWADATDEDRQKIAGGGGLLVGQVVPEVACRIGGDGEIQVSGETVLKGYLDGIGDSENKVRDGDSVWHRTGDAGYIDDQGRLWLLGRVSQAVHDAHGALYPFCVECILDAHFSIRGAVILQDGERVAVIEKDSVSPDEALKALAPQSISRVVVVKKIPMDKRHGAKVDYERLRAMVE